MDENTQPCDNCGGINFELEYGFYHCTECQARREDIREFEIEQFDELPGRNITRTIKQPEEKLEKVKLTTWECYNYAIKELVEELLILGADMLLRSVVKKLWFKYLLKLEVVNGERPKLQAVNTKIDAEIIYGKNKRVKRKRSYNSNSRGCSNSKREYARRKRIMFNSQLSESQAQLVDTSLMDETLESLKSQSQKSSQSSIPLKFNKYAKQELQRRQSTRHIKKHAKDFENILPCHRTSYKETSKKYQNSSYLLSINKIYTLIYLGLLITKSKIQLADMLRFIREGHLSFNKFKHFFPDEVSDNFLTQTCPKNTCLTSASLRESAYSMAEFLDILDYLEVQNLAALIERFCAELNLPSIIKKKALSSLIISLPKMNLSKKTKCIPNYEGRALSLILFHIKMFFFIDGKTEKYLSNFASNLNNKNTSFNMFNFMEWLQYLDYRKHALIKHHFPTEFASNKQIKNCNSFVNFLMNKNPDYESEDIYRKTNIMRQDCRNLLLKLKDRQGCFEEPIYLQPSLTPSLDHVKTLLENRYISGEIETKVLTKDFQDSSLDFIVNPSEYIHHVNKRKRVNFKLGGSRLKQHILVNVNTERSKKLSADRKFSVVCVGTRTDNCEQQEDSVNATMETVEDYVKNFKNYHRIPEIFAEMEEKLNCSKSVDQEKEPFIHFVPYECYWVNAHTNLALLSKESFRNFFSTFPDNFQFILKEMARISEQSERELLLEFSLTEIYLLYVETYQNFENDNIDTVQNDQILKIVKKAIKFW